MSVAHLYGILKLGDTVNDLKAVFAAGILFVGVLAVFAITRGKIVIAVMMFIGVVISIGIVWLSANPNALDGSIGDFIRNTLG